MKNAAILAEKELQQELDKMFSNIVSEESASEDIVNHPSHYTSAGKAYETIKVIRAWGLNKNFNLGNVVKYLSRAGKKPGEDILTALKKARWYLDDEIAWLENAAGVRDASLKEDAPPLQEAASQETSTVLPHAGTGVPLRPTEPDDGEYGVVMGWLRDGRSVIDRDGDAWFGDERTVFLHPESGGCGVPCTLRNVIKLYGPFRAGTTVSEELLAELPEQETRNHRFPFKPLNWKRLDADRMTSIPERWLVKRVNASDGTQFFHVYDVNKNCDRVASRRSFEDVLMYIRDVAACEHTIALHESKNV